MSDDWKKGFNPMGPVPGPGREKDDNHANPHSETIANDKTTARHPRTINTDVPGKNNQKR